MSNFNEDILQLIQSSDTPESSYIFNPVKGDYIRLSLFTQDGDFVDYYYSNLDVDEIGVTYNDDSVDTYFHYDPLAESTSVCTLNPELICLNPASDCADPTDTCIDISTVEQRSPLASDKQLTTNNCFFNGVIQENLIEDQCGVCSEPSNIDETSCTGEGLGECTIPCVQDNDSWICPRTGSVYEGDELSCNQECNLYNQSEASCLEFEGDGAIWNINTWSTEGYIWLTDLPFFPDFYTAKEVCNNDQITGGPYEKVQIYTSIENNYSELAYQYVTASEEWTIVTTSQQIGKIICHNINGIPDTHEGWDLSGTPQIKIYKADGDVYLKPNEILDDNDIPQGNYNLQFDFYKDVITQTSEDITGTPLHLDDAYFTITEISPSRKEVRIVVKSDDDTFDSTNESGTQFEYPYNGYPLKTWLDGAMKTITEYKFNHVLNVTRGRNILITNYTFDDTTDNTTLILRLHEPLPFGINRYSKVSINKELIKQQSQDIFYVSNVKGVIVGSGLIPDTESFSDIVNDTVNDTYQDYNELYESASFGENISDVISSSMSSQDINLNIDFSKFSNHVFFGSAVSKLENFKTKVIEIENYLNEISMSLKQTNENYHSSSHISGRRKELFSKIQNVKTNFTPYESFMYNDNQHTETSSAPGIGKNLAPTTPVNMDFGKMLSNYDGFKTVYQHVGEVNQQTHLFTDKYFVQNAPFFNYSSSIYLSFILRGDEYLSGLDSTEGILQWNNNNRFKKPFVPQDALSKVPLLTPKATGSEYRRYVYVASQSWWRPTATAGTVAGELHEYNTTSASFNAGSTEVQILSGSMIPTGSGDDSKPISVHRDDYVTYPSAYSGSPIVPDQKFSGSIMPMGELFRIMYHGGRDNAASITSSFITDVKVTLKNPIDIFPFSHLYSTGSSEWQNWYPGMHDSASAYDESNIHSLINNLPDNIREDSDSSDLKTFINMIGEHFDLVRNYIDNYINLYKRRYKEKESVPPNLLPILADNLGWEVVNPFTSSLSNYFADMSYDNNVKEIGESTWRKVLNNLIYIYKSKGTSNSIRALLNVYGYPPDFLQLNEYGGSTEESNPSIITNDAQNLLTQGMGGTSGNVHYILQKKEFYAVNLTGKKRKINVDWWTNDMKSDGVEFVFSSRETPNNQILVESSGSGLDTMWDLRLVASASSPTHGYIQFRLSNKLTGSNTQNDIGKSAVSMSTDTFKFKDTKLWNVMLQRITGSTDSEITQSYHLLIGRQDEDKIDKFQVVSMSVDDFRTNLNFISGSSLDITSSTLTVSGNLVFGETLTGSMSEVRLWSGSLSTSKFKQHVLNKFSTVGNNQDFSRDNLAAHYKLRENSVFIESNEEGTVGIVGTTTFKDANPRGPSTNPKDYTVSHSIFNDGTLYNKRIIDVLSLTTRTGGSNQQNSNRILIDPDETMIRNLDPVHKSNLSMYDKRNVGGPKRKYPQTNVDLVKSATSFLDDYIINNLSDFTIDDQIGDPRYQYHSESYAVLDDFRDSLMQDVSVDINKYIESQRNVFNDDLTSGITSLLPARSTVGSIGIMIKPNLLERSKYKYHPLSIHTGSDAGIYEGTLLNYWDHMDMSSTSSYIHNFTQSSFERPYSGSVNFLNDIYNFTGSEYKLPYSSSIPFIDDYVNLTESSVELPYSTSIDIVDNINITGSEYKLPYSSSIPFIDTYLDLSQSVELPYSSSININNEYYNFTSSFISPYTSSIDYISTYLDLSQSIELPYSTSIFYIDTYVNLTSSEYIPVYTSSIDYIDTYLDLSQSVELPYSSSINYFNDYVNLTGSRHMPYSASINYVSTYINLTSSIDLPYSTSIDIDYINFTGSDYKLPYTSSIDFVSDYLNMTSSIELPYSTSINIIDESYTFTGSSLISPYTSSITGTPDFTGSEVSFPYSASNSEISNYGVFGQGLDIQGKPYKTGSGGLVKSRLIDTWGKTFEDTHFINFVEPGSEGDYNTNHYDSTVIIHTIGDREEFSGSRNPNTYEFEIDFTNHKYFNGRFIIDNGEGYVYKTHIGTGSDANGAPVDGRPMGRTAYFTASSDGTITYPANHYIHGSTTKDSIEHLTYKGSVCGEEVTIWDEDYGQLITKVHTFEDPLYLTSGQKFINQGYQEGILVSASSYCVEVNKVGGSDAGNTLKVIRNK